METFDAHKNLAYSLIVTAPSPSTSGTSLTVTAGQGARFPEAPFNATVCPVGEIPTPENSEVIRVTNVSTDTLTIVRTQEGTSAHAIIAGDAIWAGPTAKSLEDIEDSINTVEETRNLTTLMKGVGRPRDAVDSVNGDLSTLNVSWWYDWWYQAEDADTLPGVQYVPMVFGDWDVYSSATPQEIVDLTGTDVLLGFNEPDFVEQSNITVERALELWADMEATGVRLGSPAVSAGETGPAWLAEFMAAGPRVDFICAHWYPDFSPDEFVDFITGLWETYKLPIWITEVGSLTGGPSVNADLIPEIIAAVEKLSYVERIAWFATRDADGWTGAGLLTSGTNIAFPSSGFWPAIWSQYSNTTGSSSVSLNGWGKQATGVAGSYADNTFEILDDILSANTTISLDCKITDINECFPVIHFRSDANTQNCFNIQIQPAAGNLLFRKRTGGGSYTTLATIAPTFSVNDVLHIELIMNGSTIELRVWKNADTKPTLPTAVDTSGTVSTQTRFLLGLVGGNASTSRTVEWKINDFSLDPGGEETEAGAVYADLPSEIVKIGTDGQIVQSYITLSTGFAGGQSVVGGTRASENLVLSSTSHATKGKIIFGSSAYDEALDYMGLGTEVPTHRLDVVGELALPSTNAGGENTSDSTSRLVLNSHQRAENTNNFGEVIRIYSDHARSKQMFAWYKRFNTGAVTFTDSGDVWNATAHGLENADRVVLSTTVALPTGYSIGTTAAEGATTGQVYYVVSATTNTFQLALTAGGSAVVGTGTGTGVHTFTIVPKLKAWVGWHYLPNDVSDTLSPHDHWSIETNDADGLIRTRFEVMATNANTTQVNTFNSNFTVIQGTNGVSGTDGNTKSFSIFTSTTNRDKTIRWALQGNATAESGSNVGTDFQIARFADNGGFADAPFFIKRSNGKVGIGSTVSSPLARLHVQEASDATIIFAKQTLASRALVAGFLSEATTSDSRVFQSRIDTDTVARLSIEASGRIEWGAGGSSARDVTLYRSAADVLKTDDAFEVLDEVYSSSWNGSVSVPTKNAVYDKLEAVIGYQKKGLAKTSGGTLQFGIPNALFITQNTSNLTINEDRYLAINVLYPITITAHQFEVTAAPASNANVRIGIYLADADLQPSGNPIYDVGISVASGFTGLKTTSSLSITLQPGVYLVAMNCDVTMGIRTLGTPAWTVQAGMGATSFAQRYTVSRTYAGFPSPGTKWTSMSGSTGGLQHGVVFQWTE